MLDARAYREGRRKIGQQTNWESLETRCLLSASQIDFTPQLSISPSAATSGTVQGITPAQITTAYGFNNITLPGGAVPDGAGQTIAIVDAFNDPNISKDLSTFDKQFNLPTANLSVVSGTGSKTLPSTDAGWATEISLDVEWAHATAPGAKILLVEAKSDSLTDLLSAVNYARSAAGVSVVSLSWGGSEFYQETQYDSDFTTPAGHQGVTFVAASGDEGSFSGPSWPASSPNVLAVGGTTLNLTSTNTIASETAWSDSTGGFSRFEAEPDYQQIAQFSGGKSSPDVAYDANPNTGFAVYDSLAYQGDSGWQVYGGTSAGTPQWAALIAIADQGRVANGASTLDGGTSTLPTLYSLYTQAQYLNNFNDITAGRSSFRTTALPGYDLVTGLGSPQAGAVVSALINSTITPTAAVKAKATAQIRVRTQARRAVVEEIPVQDQKPNQSQSTAAQKQSPIEVQVYVQDSSSTPSTSGGDFALPLVERSNVQTIGATRSSTFAEDSSLQVQSAQAEAPLLGRFSFTTHSSTAANHDDEIPRDAIQLHDSAMEAGLLATRSEDSSTAWKQIAALLGAGVVIGTYSAKVRRQKRTVGML